MRGRLYRGSILGIGGGIGAEALGVWGMACLVAVEALTGVVDGLLLFFPWRILSQSEQNHSALVSAQQYDSMLAPTLPVFSCLLGRYIVGVLLAYLVLYLPLTVTKRREMLMIDIMQAF